MAYGIPLKAGIGVPLFPPLSGFGLRHSSAGIGLHCIQHSPLRCRGGPCATTEKAQEGPSEALLVFLHPSLAYKSKLLTLGTGTKKALKRCLRAFFRCCAVRGGFEPPVRLPVRQFSKLVVSATHPSHLSAQWVICLHKRFGTAKIC